MIFKDGSILEKNVELVLSGAMKVLGCNSASLLFIDENQGFLRIWASAPRDETEGFEQTSRLLGFVPRGAVVSLDLLRKSFLLASYRQKKIFETSNISDLVSDFLPEQAQNVLQSFIGQLRFSCVPVVGRDGIVHGVILFSKKGDRPFSFQQRMLQIDYASRLGAIIESEKFSEDVEQIRTRLAGMGEEIPYSIRKVLDTGKEAVLALDGAQTIVSVNRWAEEMFGKKAEQLIGSPFEILFFGEEAAGKVLEARIRLQTDGHMEMRGAMKREGGERFEAEISGVLTLDEARNISGAIIRIKELEETGSTPEVNFQENLVRSERMAFISEIASKLAHEIRNPLLSIGAALRVIKDEFPDDHPLQEELKMVINEVDRLDKITKDYLSLSRRPAGRIEHVKLEEILNEAMRVVSVNPVSSGIEIHLNIMDSVEILGDFDALKQVFINLLMNAVEASKPGDFIECVLELDSKNNNVLVKILDRGEGLEGKDLNMLFTPFFTTKTNGSGLGLAISKSIIESVGGFINLLPRNGGGCEAIIQLPVYRF